MTEDSSDNKKSDSSGELQTEQKEAAKKNDMPIRPDICRVPIKDVKRFCLSFSGCGFLGSYHFGAGACFVKHGKAVLSRMDRVSGASAGSLVGSLLLACPDKLPDGLKKLYAMANELNSLKFGALSPGYYLNERLIKVVDEFLPKTVEIWQSKMYISLTKHKTRENVLKNNYISREQFLQCLMASCYIPMYSMGYAAKPPEIDGEAYIDGGYSNNLPDFEDIRTITISPFSGSAEISPLDPAKFFDWQMTLCKQQLKVNLRNIVRGAQALFPPSEDVLRDYYDMGFRDTLRFLVNNNLVERPKGTEV